MALLNFSFMNKIRKWFDDYHKEENVTGTLWDAESAQNVRDCLFLGDDIDGLENGMTPFIYHCEKGNMEVVLELVAQGCNFRYKRRGNYSGLHYVCVYGQYNLLVELSKLEDFRELIVDDSCDLLSACCVYGHTDIFDFLLSLKCNPHARSIDGSTVLMHACFYKQIDIIDRLLKLDVDVNAKNHDGENALMKLIIGVSNNDNDVTILDKLFVHGFLINDPEKYYLHLAVSVSVHQQKFNLVEALLNYGANINAINPVTQCTPLMIASYLNNNEMVTFLLKYGAEKTI